MVGSPLDCVQMVVIVSLDRSCHKHQYLESRWLPGRGHCLGCLSGMPSPSLCIDIMWFLEHHWDQHFKGGPGPPQHLRCLNIPSQVGQESSQDSSIHLGRHPSTPTKKRRRWFEKATGKGRKRGREGPYEGKHIPLSSDCRVAVTKVG